MSFLTRTYSGKQQVTIYFAGTLIRQLTGFMMLPIYTTHLTPADYGVAGLLITMLGIVELLFGARFGQALPKFFYEEKDEHARKKLICTALLGSIGISVISYILISPFNSEISSALFGNHEHAYVVKIYLIALVTVGVESYGLAYMRIKEWAIPFTLSSILKLILQLSLNIYFIVFQEMGVYGIVLASIISSSVFAFIYAIVILKYTSFSFDTQLMKRLLVFCWPLWIAGMAALYVGSSSRIFIRYFSSLTDVGLYELAFKFASIIPMLLWRPFSQWWQTERFKIYRQEDKGIGVYNSVFNRMAFAMLTVAFLISAFYGVAIQIMASPEYLVSREAISPLVLALALASLTNFYFFSFLVCDKTRCISVLHFLTALNVTIAIIFLVPLYGFRGAAYALLISNAITLLVAANWSKKYFDNKIKLMNLFKLIITFMLLTIASESLQARSSGLLSNLLIICSAIVLWASIGYSVMRRFIPAGLLSNLISKITSVR